MSQGIVENSHLYIENKIAHYSAVLAFGLVILLSTLNPTITLIGMFLFLIVSSFKMIWQMLLIMLVVGVATLIFPPLAAIALILMIVFFFMRIGFVIRHWRPIVCGILLYGYGVMIGFSGMPIPGVSALIFALIGITGMHFALQNLYRNGYTTELALGIMGSVPLVILAFILPFLKIYIPTPDIVLEPVGHSVTTTTTTPGVTSGTTTISSSGEATFVEPHYVKSHVRSDGTFVEGYWRDGDGDTSVNRTVEEGGGYYRSN